MALIVQKYGSTSVGNVEHIRCRAESEGSRARTRCHCCCLCHEETNRLIGILRSSATCAARDECIGIDRRTGHDYLLAMALTERGCAASYTGGQVRIHTDSARKARIQAVDDENMHADLKAGQVVIIAGFKGMDDNNNIATLGRGGSDTTAVALAAAFKADECQIYTDVDGV